MWCQLQAGKLTEVDHTQRKRQWDTGTLKEALLAPLHRNRHSCRRHWADTAPAAFSLIPIECSNWIINNETTMAVGRRMQEPGFTWEEDKKERQCTTASSTITASQWSVKINRAQKVVATAEEPFKWWKIFQIFVLKTKLLQLQGLSTAPQSSCNVSFIVQFRVHLSRGF